jgi:hypothetical protein
VHKILLLEGVQFLFKQQNFNGSQACREFENNSQRFHCLRITAFIGGWSFNTKASDPKRSPGGLRGATVNDDTALESGTRP